MLFELKKFARARELFKGYLKINQDDTEIQSLFQQAERMLEKVRKLGYSIEEAF